MLTILVADDQPEIVTLLEDLLTGAGFGVLKASSGDKALSHILNHKPDLALLDLEMPGMSGYEVCQAAQKNRPNEFFPIIILSGRGSDHGERAHGLDVGAYDFLSKPFSPGEVLAKIRAFLRMKELHVTVEKQKRELEAWASTLNERVKLQVEQIGHLKRFFSPQIAELIMGKTEFQGLQSHSADVTIVFCDLRGFTSFSDNVSATEVMKALEEYYSTMGTEAMRFGGTIGRLSGDGMLVYFNDPIALPNHLDAAIDFAIAARERLRSIRTNWSAKSFSLGFGFGVDSGRVTAGPVGFEQYLDYTVIGMPVNLASRLCAHAEGDQILVSEHCVRALKDKGRSPCSEEIYLKGFKRPVRAHSI